MLGSLLWRILLLSLGWWCSTWCRWWWWWWGFSNKSTRFATPL